MDQSFYNILILIDLVHMLCSWRLKMLMMRSWHANSPSTMISLTVLASESARTVVQDFPFYFLPKGFYQRKEGQPVSLSMSFA